MGTREGGGRGRRKRGGGGGGRREEEGAPLWNRHMPLAQLFTRNGGGCEWWWEEGRKEGKRKDG